MKPTPLLTKIARSAALVAVWTYALANHPTEVGYSVAATGAAFLIAAIALPIVGRFRKGQWGITAKSIGKFLGVAFVVCLGIPTAFALLISALDALSWVSATPAQILRWAQFTAAAILACTFAFHLARAVKTFKVLQRERDRNSTEHRPAKLLLQVSKECLEKVGNVAGLTLLFYSWISASIDHPQTMQKVLWMSAVVGSLFGGAWSFVWFALAKKFRPTQLGIPLLGALGGALFAGTFYSLGVGVVDLLTYVASRPGMMYWAVLIAGGAAVLLGLGGAVLLIRRHGKASRDSSDEQHRVASEESKNIVLERWAQTSFLTSTLPTINYVWTHSLDDFFVVAEKAALVAAILSVIVTALAFFFKKEKPGALWFFISFIVIPGVIFVSAFGVYSLYVSVLDLFSWVQPKNLSTSAILFRGGAIALALGTLFFYIRLRLRCVYGVTEVAAGMIIAADRVMDQSLATTPVNSGFYFAVLTAGIYLVVRGLDNIHQGLTKEPRDPLAQALVNYLALKEDDKRSKRASSSNRPSTAAPTSALPSDPPPD